MKILIEHIQNYTLIENLIILFLIKKPFLQQARFFALRSMQLLSTVINLAIDTFYHTLPNMGRPPYGKHTDNDFDDNHLQFLTI